ncbi:hypothetical protein OJ996_01740 [Luteolibacter sp. GHJ8]|uniref:Uncharacterized protein n=1 Tax=Luteolibacter rhizosphaerae TaxID=2989719 RepID=A0ABT3FZ76_9BACT|nr:hypothetical protein [Luteolibacter rhizosphaerae]MCW1912275.1 hypothetical protein [Luteolibacter rhizosphaerae]
MISGQDFQRGLELAGTLSPAERADQVQSLILIGAGKHHQEASGLLAEYLGTKPAREDLARLGRTLLALDRPLAEQIVADAANDSDRAYLSGKVFPPESQGIEVAAEGSELMQDGDAAVANEAM